MNRNSSDLLILVTNELLKNPVQSFDCHAFIVSNRLQDEEIEQMLWLAFQHKIFVVLSLFRPWVRSETLQKEIDEYNSQRRHYYAEFQSIARTLNEAKIKYVVVKGVPLSCMMYGEPYLRGVGDIDYVVDESQIDHVFRLFQSLGYQQTQCDAQERPVFLYGVHHHEIEMSRYIEGICVDIELKKRTSCLPKDFHQWWPHVRQKDFNGTLVNTLNGNYEILHLLINTFSDNESKCMFLNCYLRPYFDVAYMIRHVRFDWLTVLNAAEQMEMTHQVAVVLRSVAELYPILEEDICDILTLISEKYGRYNQSLFYYGADKEKFTNCGLVPDRPRAKLLYSIFDHDFSVFQFAKSYKATMYSKNNPDYQLRLKMEPQSVSEPKRYANYHGIRANYWYACRGQEFQIITEIDHSCQAVFAQQYCYVTLLWYSNDINSPVVTEKYLSPQINELDKLNWDMDGLSQFEGEYYTSQEYATLLQTLPVQRLHISSQVLANATRITFSFQQETIFFPLDIKNFEVKFSFLCHGKEADIHIDLGSEDDYIECL